MKKICTSIFNFLVIFLILSFCTQSESRILNLSDFVETSQVRGRSIRQTLKPNPSPMRNANTHQFRSPPPMIMK
ncbi:hypothetical protein EJD97_010050 [Solanum chilense]|uniref:Uncharacterized protein n=1 Tax=Solanum chilense TaxID=4083 RepID=A0A6N2BHV3_SOLCI|nr:hypothetical protein EJD97_010050 [Solanum chilense]